MSIEQHYCLGKLKSISLFENHGDCHDTHDEELPPCCDDVIYDLKMDETTHPDVKLGVAPPMVFIIPLVYAFILQKPQRSSEPRLNYSVYIPPTIERDIPVLVQSFLI